MIQIQRKEDCVGCSACVERCPVNCISFERDQQGFRYPQVDTSKCINCSLCERVCPVINRQTPSEPLAVYGAINPDNQIVSESSSGGIFHALALNILNHGGVIFGACFDENYNVIHSYTESPHELPKFMGSKYVQSDIGSSFLQAEKFLKQGRKVLFSGTPCQIAGLTLFLRKDYGDLLLKVAVICHGVPSPLVWTNYLKEKIGSPDEISRISFRDKHHSWVYFGLSYTKQTNNKSKYHFEFIHDNTYMQAFLHDITLRPSCFECPAKDGRSRSDIIIGDFWRVKSLEPEIASESGTSLILINTEAGAKIFEELNIRSKSSTLEKAYISNPALFKSFKMPMLYDTFWHEYLQTNSLKTLVKFTRKAQGSFSYRLRQALSIRVRRFVIQVRKKLNKS